MCGKKDELCIIGKRSWEIESFFLWMTATGEKRKTSLRFPCLYSVHSSSSSSCGLFRFLGPFPEYPLTRFSSHILMVTFTSEIISVCVHIRRVWHNMYIGEVRKGIGERNSFFPCQEKCRVPWNRERGTAPKIRNASAAVTNDEAAATKIARYFATIRHVTAKKGELFFLNSCLLVEQDDIWLPNFVRW